MKIHTVKNGELLADIAAEYGVSEASVRSVNGIISGQAAVGEELVILIPTRTYTIRQGDSLERLCLRFGTRKSELYAMNPEVSFESPHPGDCVAVRYAPKSHGMAAANGYYYKGCGKDSFVRALPYLTYITVASCILENGRLSELFDGANVAREARLSGKIPILRIYCKHQNLSELKNKNEVMDGFISEAQKGGYRGIAISGRLADGADELAELLLEMRKRLIGSDLILITESDESSPACLTDYADGCVLSYYKDDEKSFAEGERKIFEDFAARAEGAKTFIDLPCLAKVSGSYLPLAEATALARSGYEITTDEKTLISSFNHKRKGTVRFPSMKSIKATLDLIGELGFMGISFDIMRTPRKYLSAYSSMYKTVTECSVRQIER